MSKFSQECLVKLAKIVRVIGKVSSDDMDFSVTVDLFDYGYLDSFGIVELITIVQEEFGADLTSTDFYGDDIRTIEKISQHIEDKTLRDSLR